MSDAAIDQDVQVNTDDVAVNDANDVMDIQEPDQPVDQDVETPAGDDQAAATVPEAYTIPEGSDVAQGDLDYVSDLAKSMGLDNDNAIKLVQGLRDHEQTKIDEANAASVQVKKDMGAEAYSKMLSGAKQAYQAAGETAGELVKEFPYLGTHPKFISMFSKLYSSFMAEDKTNVGDVNHTAPKPKTTAEKLFGS